MTFPRTARSTATPLLACEPGRVLAVLDRPVLCEIVKMTLHHCVYCTRTATIASEVAIALTEWQPQLAILDMDLDRDRIMPILRAKPGGVRLPVIGLTRRGDLKTKLAAYEAGVDDILTVPFAPEELLVRVLAVMRRSYGDAVTFTPVIKVDDLEINILRRTVRAGTLELHLTSLEQSLLYLLVANAGRVVTREEILDALWGADYVAERSVVDRQIRNLRARFHHESGRRSLISTVPGRGYQFASDCR